MKILAFLMLLGTFSTGVFAQKPAAKTAQTLTAEQEAAARLAAEKLSEKYAFNADQAKQTYTVQVRKQRNMAQIEPLKTTNPALFRAKTESIQRGTLASLRRVLRSKEQVEIFKKTQAAVRARRAEKQKELLTAGASKEVVSEALLAIFEE